MSRPAAPGHPRRGLPTSPAARFAMGTFVVAELAAKTCMLIEVLRRPQEELKGPRWAWVLAAFVNTLGPLAWFGWGRRQKRVSQ